jgi:hypothetical protein
MLRSSVGIDGAQQTSWDLLTRGRGISRWSSISLLTLYEAQLWTEVGTCLMTCSAALRPYSFVAVPSTAVHRSLPHPPLCLPRPPMRVGD